MIDTNVLYFVFDPPLGRVQEAPSQALWTALVQHKRDILIATPTLAEFLRQGGSLSSAHGMEYIGFDKRAAELVATALPGPVITQSGIQAGVSKPAIKFDTLIMACAIRGRADAIITYDKGYKALKANSVGSTFANLQLFKPDDLMVAPPAPPPAVPAKAPPAKPPPPNIPP
jgi:predicted nucleic acid-binding protein